MKRVLTFLTIATAVGLVLTACTQSAPTPAVSPVPTKAAVAATATSPAKAPEPSKVPTAPPTAVPTKTVDFPVKGRAVTIIVPFAAGGPTDVGARLLVTGMEKYLGTPVQVVNKAGAGSQIGLTELATSKPDGYTLAYANLPPAISIYLDPELKAAFGRKDLQLVANHVIDAGAVAVKADSPYKTIKDLVDAGKARPGVLTGGITAIGGLPHLSMLQVQKLTGAKFSSVQFDGASTSLTALLGGHIDSHWGAIGDFGSMLKSPDIRILGIMDKQESPFAPGIKTMEAQGYPVNISSARGLVLPAGTPKEIETILSDAIKKAVDEPAHKQKMNEMGLALRYMGPAEYSAFWNDYEATVADLMKLIRS